jgi:hypothetical protein
MKNSLHLRSVDVVVGYEGNAGVLALDLGVLADPSNEILRNVENRLDHLKSELPDLSYEVEVVQELLTVNMPKGDKTAGAAEELAKRRAAPRPPGQGSRTTQMGWCYSSRILTCQS